ncbi:hypothetical protein HRM2_22790 [Desulforapulum autotrophicum HRM2]|uniref:Uncharacterized protein n=1 Tax=Desulforapulum autotrophicum (strain ATCC 43914 / DSM 3382 / VKM B-1955 / HRM2) TaxID=177437 RepID=C0QEN2_DESAH|nr:hypothetical protein [Desulforapulum autotrophicum]ACN15374.1 hypothetical protein HRM2_22790 [Desulforapulum autotrophicum HRM2]
MKQIREPHATVKEHPWNNVKSFYSTIRKQHTQHPIELVPLSPVLQGKQVQTAVEIHSLEAKTRLWFKFPATVQNAVTDLLDPFVTACVFLAMRVGCDVIVRGPVSKSLIENLSDFQQIWTKWYPDRYTHVKILPDSIVNEATQVPQKTAMMFSGGLDSCFTAWKHTIAAKTFPRRTPDAAILVHGFDIPLDDTRGFSNTLLKARQITDSIDLELIPVQYNFRQVVGDWEESHATALASCLHLFNRRFSAGLIASSHSYDALRFPWGSNPLTDTLLSSRQMKIFNDGGECSRWQKAASIAGWEPAVQHLRVCHKGRHKDENCGVCAQCLITALCFAATRHPIPDCLNVGSIQQTIKALQLLPIKPSGLLRIQALAAFARERGNTAPWVSDFEACCSFHENRLNQGAPMGSWMLFRRKWFKAFR